MFSPSLIGIIIISIIYFIVCFLLAHERIMIVSVVHKSAHVLQHHTATPCHISILLSLRVKTNLLSIILLLNNRLQR